MPDQKNDIIIFKYMLKYNFGIPQVNWSVVRLIMKTNKRSIKVTVGVIKVQYSKLYMTV